MTKTTASADGGAMPASGHKTRRAALALFAGAPALAILPAAAATSTTTLADLIEAHRAAWAGFVNSIDSLEAAEPDRDVLIPCMAREPCKVIGRSKEDLLELIEENFASEVRKLARLSELAPELGHAARGRLETAKTACLARLEEVFAARMAASEVYEQANEAEEDALMEICAHRCASMEEAAVKVGYIVGQDSELLPEQLDALFASFLPEGAELDAA